MSEPSYPASVDILPRPSTGDPVTARMLNDLHLLVLAVEATVGLEARRTTGSVKQRIGNALEDDGRWPGEVLCDEDLAWYPLFLNAQDVSEGDGSVRWMARAGFDSDSIGSGLKSLRSRYAVFQYRNPVSSPDGPDNFDRCAVIQKRGTNTHSLKTGTYYTFTTAPSSQVESPPANGNLSANVDAGLQGFMAAHSLGSSTVASYFGLEFDVAPRRYPSSYLYASRPYYHANYA